MQTVALDAYDLALTVALILIPGLCSVALGLGLGRRLAIASVRTVAQLGLLAFVLEWVFAVDGPWLMLAIVLSMLVNAGFAGVRRTKRRYRGIWRNGLFSLSLSGVATAVLVCRVIIDVDPWYTPRYLIPLLGMALGNTLTGIALALDRIMADLDEKRDEIEAWLALGAHGWEACRPFAQEAIRVGMVPIINSMTVVGIVSLPGMMTGQLLAGAPPQQAVQYQIVVMFMVAGGTSMGTVLAVMATLRQMITPSHQLASHRLWLPNR